MGSHSTQQRRSWVLIGLLGLILPAFGFVIGGVIYGDVRVYGAVQGVPSKYVETIDALTNGRDPPPWPAPTQWLGYIPFFWNEGAVVGLLIAAALAVVLTLVAWFAGDAAVLQTAGAHEISKQDAPQLWNVIEEMVLAAGLPTMPRVYLVDDDAPNAFAVGRRPELAAVAVTSGLLKRLNRDELQGVIGHEIGHICNYDIRFLTLASILLGSIVLIADIFLRTLRYGGRRSSSRGGSGAVILFVIAIVFALLAPIMARILFFACSRRREYLADASSAQFTRYPEGLASALEKIGNIAPDHANRALAALYIVNPLQSPSSSSIFSTHPPLNDRIAILRAMGGMSGFVDYQRAFEKRFGGKQECFNGQFLKDQTSLPARPPVPEPRPRSEEAGHAREGIDVLDRAANFLMVPCACGLRLKIPPGLHTVRLKCPRCGRLHELPRAQAAQSAAPAPQLTYRRRTTGWESFRCACHHTLQISPNFNAASMTCPKCDRRIVIVPFASA